MEAHNDDDDNNTNNNNGPSDGSYVMMMEQPHRPPRGGDYYYSSSSFLPHEFSFAWCTSLHGSEYVTLVLWIGKDWSWSQLGWEESAVICGTAAVLWMMYVILYGSLCHPTTTTTRRPPLLLYSELYKNGILSLWLVGLYAWMVGEFWTLWYTPGYIPSHHALVFEARGNTICKWCLLTAVVLYALYYVLLVPFDVFASDRRHVPLQEVAGEAAHHSRPAYPCAWYFKEFRVYSGLHFFTWVLKDTFWAWEYPVAYGVAFVMTVLLNVDLLWRFGGQGRLRHYYIDFVHYVVILLWVTANGLWAFGELVANTNATEDQYRTYRWPRWQEIHGTSFQFRYSAGWTFLLSASVLFVFYVHWIVLTMRGSLPSYEEYEKEQQQQQNPEQRQSTIIMIHGDDDSSSFRVLS